MDASHLAPERLGIMTEPVPLVDQAETEDALLKQAENDNGMNVRENEVTEGTEVQQGVEAESAGDERVAEVAVSQRWETEFGHEQRVEREQMLVPEEQSIFGGNAGQRECWSIACLRRCLAAGCTHCASGRCSCCTAK